MRKLIVMRHAKSDWNCNAILDIDRPLATRGEKDIIKIASNLSNKITPDVILCSPAKRTIQTAKGLIKLLIINTKALEIKPILYHGDLQDYLNLIQDHFAKFETIMIVGHNPTVTEIYNYFSEIKISNVPTSGLFVIDLIKTDSKISGKVIEYYYPKLFGEQ